MSESLRRIENEADVRTDSSLAEGRSHVCLDTDASDVGLRAVLSQVQDGTERVIAYSSRTMNRSEAKYETTRNELLAVVNGLKQFRQYLLGRHFVIRTDHAALSWLRRTPEPIPQSARWLTLIEQYDYEVVHRDGRRHGNTDGLSRRPPTSEAQKEVSSFHQEKNEDDEKLPKLKAIGQTNNETDSFAGEEAPLVRESLASLQKASRCTVLFYHCISLLYGCGLSTCY